MDDANRTCFIMLVENFTSSGDAVARQLVTGLIEGALDAAIFRLSSDKSFEEYREELIASTPKELQIARNRSVIEDEILPEAVDA